MYLKKGGGGGEGDQAPSGSATASTAKKKNCFEITLMFLFSYHGETNDNNLRHLVLEKCQSYLESKTFKLL